MKNLTLTLTGCILMGLTILSCKKDDSQPVDCNAGGPAVTAATTDASCGNNNGGLEATGSGGKQPYQYSMDGNTFQPSKTFANLAAGSYTLTIKDANGCTNTSVVTINQPGAPAISETKALSTTCGTSAGKISVVVNGGKAPLQFSIDGNTFKPITEEFTNLAAGNYTITVRDAAGCTSTASAMVGVNPNSISYEATVKNIIATNCAISGCHVAGTGRPNFTDFSVIQSRAALIKTRTGNRSMPIGRTLTDEQIAQIACWVDAGAPSN